MATAELISSMAEHIVRHFDPLRVVLFGSHARGDADPGSDVDLLVVLPEVADKRQVASFRWRKADIRRSLATWPVSKDICERVRLHHAGRDRAPRTPGGHGAVPGSAGRKGARGTRSVERG